MAEEEINIEDDALSLEDSEDSNVTDVEVKGIANHVILNLKNQKTIDTMMKQDGFVHIETIEVYMDLTFNLLKQKNLEYLLK
jgi:hypothetical protein